MTKPNILFVQGDRLAAVSLRARGGVAFTPDLDVLAARGAAF